MFVEHKRAVPTSKQQPCYGGERGFYGKGRKRFISDFKRCQAGKDAQKNKRSKAYCWPQWTG